MRKITILSVTLGGQEHEVNYSCECPENLEEMAQVLKTYNTSVMDACMYYLKLRIDAHARASAVGKTPKSRKSKYIIA